MLRMFFFGRRVSQVMYNRHVESHSSKLLNYKAIARYRQKTLVRGSELPKAEFWKNFKLVGRFQECAVLKLGKLK